jgi:ankyrin repeat protein
MKKAKKVFMKILIYITLLVTLFVVAYRYIDPALFTLIRANQNTVPKIFLFLGKDPNMINKKNASLLSQACFSNNKDMVKFLIDKGADNTLIQ